MKAFVMHRYGGPDVARFGEVATPTPAAGEVLIRVRAAGLNPVDHKIREGKLKVVSRLALPCVLGNELAGDVVGRGAGVSDFAIGDRVFARVGKATLGAFAEFACVPEAFVAPMPRTLDFEHAAAVPLAGLTALQALRDELRVRPGMQLLITGAAGGVGSFAIPLARHYGAQVTTTASPRGEALVRRLGADHVIDYTRQRLGEGGRDFDAAFDLIGGETLLQCFERVKAGERVLSIAGVPEPRTARIDLQRGRVLQALFWAISHGVRTRARRHAIDYRYLFMHPSGVDLRVLAGLIDAGTLPVTVDRVFPFAQIQDAFAHLEAGHAKGKVVVRME
ncbi:MAG: NADP-dependent oxidoreductase [Lysobacter sp.]